MGESQRNQDYFDTDNLASSVAACPLPSYQLNTQQEGLLKRIEQVENTLKTYEIVSLLFFLHEDAGETYVDLVQFLSEGERNTNFFSKWCKKAIKKDTQWESKFLESLFLIRNYKILKHFDIEAVNAVHLFNHRYLISNLRLCLYRVCENITNSKLDLLLERMGESDSRYKDYLELYILKWISEGKLSIDKQVNIRPLVDGLKAINHYKLADQLLNFELLSTPPSEQLYSNLRFDEAYPIIDPNNVGLCVIINQKKFTKDESSARNKDPSIPELVLKERIGTEKDCEALIKTLTFLKFDVEVIHNVKSTAIINVIQNQVKNCFKPSHSVFFLIILSHGHKGVVYGSDSKPVQIAAIDYCLLLQELKGKPKVIIIQACQGDYYVKAPELETDAPVKEWPKDTIFCMATIPYFASYRHKEEGTWYIQTLCEMLQENPDLNLVSLLIKVHKKLYNEPVFNREKGIRSIPEFQCRLEKDLYLRSKTN